MVEKRKSGEGIMYVPRGSPRGERRPPEPLFSESSVDSLVVGMCSLLFDILVVVVLVGEVS